MSGAGLKFIIVGASVAGLASAVALKASGHSVLVLEKEAQLGGTSSIPSGCARVPPNGCKILFDWGLETETRAKTTIGNGFSLYKYDGKKHGRDFMGINRWDPELLTEARGDFVHFRHEELLRLLYDQAIKPPPHSESDTKMKQEESAVVVLFGAEVVEVDCDAATVTLKSGEIHAGDAIIGADGACGVVRRKLMEEEDAAQDDVRTGLAIYGATIPRALAIKDKDLATFCENKTTIAAGSNRGAMTCLMGKESDITLWIYTPDSSQDGTWTTEAERKLPDILGSCDVELQKLAALAGPATCVQIQDRYQLESWVSESGKVLVLGEAAHPFPPASMHTYSVALEDGAFIGKIFSHTRNPDRIPEFLYAFQEHREERCARICETEKQYIEAITIPDGEMQEARDAGMRANHAAGRNVLDGDMEQMLEDTRMVFSYEPMDDADEWWMSWGRLRDKSEVDKGSHRPESWSFSTFTSQDEEEARCA
ncbi:hypothetical protein C8R44DRAFT_974572 [Mycena epipterygia]|nr:hypothetical protein C8R44DRAFT_974572 [Mycena epipterygia]